MKATMPEPAHGPLHAEATQALHEAIGDVIAEHKRLGMPLSVLRNGKVVRISPEDAEAEYLAAKAKTEANPKAAS